MHAVCGKILQNFPMQLNKKTEKRNHNQQSGKLFGSPSILLWQVYIALQTNTTTQKEAAQNSHLFMEIVIFP